MSGQDWFAVTVFALTTVVIGATVRRNRDWIVAAVAVATVAFEALLIVAVLAR